MNKPRLDTDGSHDRPDHYRRDALAERIASALVRPLGTDSLVVALDGPWGSGKTWLLDKVAICLSSQENNAEKRAHVVRFSPWQIAEETDLILDFLIQLALELSPTKHALDKTKGASRKLLKYAKALSYGRYLKYVPVPVIDKLGEVIEDATNAASDVVEKADEALEDATRPSLADARHQAREAIAGLGMRVVVLIDDIDRLRSREVRAVMQLIKSVADFPQTSFLLAFDAEYVAKAVTEDAQVDTGTRYLEKIVQLSVPVPRLDRNLLTDNVRKNLADALTASGHTLKPYESPLMDSAVALVVSLCDTPRDVVRWANHLAWAAAALRDSVNMADLCVVEAFRLKAKRATWDRLTNSRALNQQDFDLAIGEESWMTWAKQTELEAI